MSRSVAVQPAARDAATQDIRLAVVLNGGVSLAVWMSGVTHELNLLVQASRGRGTPDARPSAYADLLDVLQADARIDVIAGTSAGGINGGFLALGLVHGCDLTGLRTLWQDQGALGTLLRNPGTRTSPPCCAASTSTLSSRRPTPGSGRPAGRPGGTRRGRRPVPHRHALGGTAQLLRRRHGAPDHGGRLRRHLPLHLRPRDPHRPRHRLRPRRSAHPGGDRAAGGGLPVHRVLPGRVRALRGHGGRRAVQLPDGRWPSEAGRANFRRSQFVIDGGILRNKPIRPAIDAVYRQPADQQVRRILAYVVPDPGEAATGPGKPAVTDLPGAAQVMLGVMTRLRSTDSVADELAEIGRRNAETAHRRRARDRLARTLVDAAAAPVQDDGTDLVRSAYPGYLEVRRGDTAESVARLLLSAPRQHPWSQRELATVLRDLAADSDFPFIPQPDLDAALGAAPAEWRWGQATVRRLGDLLLDVLKRAVWLAPLTDADRATIVATGPRRTRSCAPCGASDRRSTPTGGPRPCPTAATDSPPGPGSSPPSGRRWRGSPRSGVRDGPPAGMAARLNRLALDLAHCLLAAGEALRSISAGRHAAVDSDGTEQARLRALVDLLVPAGATAGRRPARHAPPRGGARRVHGRQRRPRAGRRAGAGQLAARRAGHGRATAPLRRLLPGVLAGQRLVARPGRRLRAGRPDAPGARTAPAARPHGRGSQSAAALGRRRAGPAPPGTPSWPRPGTPWTTS